MSLDPGPSLWIESEGPLSGQPTGRPGDDRDLVILLRRRRRQLLDCITEVFCAELDVVQQSIWNGYIAGLETSFNERWEQSMVPIGLWTV